MADGRAWTRWTRPGDDSGAAFVVSSIIALAVFALTLVLLVTVANEPMSTAKPDDAVLRARATDALAIIGGSAGYPPTWGESDASVQGMNRLGLVQEGRLRTLEPNKFDALAKGKVTGATADGKVDYEEARTSLGLDGYDFHLRAYPVFQPFPHGTYGVTGMDDWRVAYVGHYPGGTEGTESTLESGGLDDLPISFQNWTRGGNGTGDKYRDDSNYLRQRLVPLLGSLQNVTSLSGNLPPEQFRRMNSSQLTDAGLPAPRTGTGALAIGEAGGGPEYVKNTNMRGVLGYANLSLITNPRISFYEIVHGEGYNQSSSTCLAGSCTWTYLTDFQDYGIVEASLDNGTTWIPLTPASSVEIGRMPSVYSETVGSAPTAPASSTWKHHTVDFSQCPSCINKQEVLLAVRWVSDNDNTLGKGWLIDDFVVESASTGARVMHLGFESPYYAGLIIGSNVAQNAMTPQELKSAIRDFVLQGGKLFVMGGQQNVQWLQPLFNVGIAGSSGQAFVPDTTHPLLTIPNELDWDGYDNHGESWEFSSAKTKDLFSNVVQGTSQSQYVLAVSNQNTFGDGQVMLTTWHAHEMTSDQLRRWLANAIVYGKYHYLYMEVGPNVPPGVPVASASMTALMDKTRDNSQEFIEMSLVLYVWK